jgi:2,5-furandicarboxylate decarboxylase 1
MVPVPHFLSMRQWLARLAQTGRLAVAAPRVELKHRLAAIAKRLDGKQAVWFPQPGGHTVPVVSGLVASRAWIAEAMGVAESGLLARFSDAVANPTPWREVSRADALAQQVVHERFDLRDLFPIPTHSEHDSGPYISAGLLIARNPKTGIQNVSINRVQVLQGARLQALLLPRHLAAFHRIAESSNEPLDVAIVIGVDPMTLLASQAITPIDFDELTVAGSLLGAPLEVVKCLGSEVRVPATAEIVIEGRLLPSVREQEGPFGEFPKYYSERDAREVIEVTRVTHRRDPIYHTIVPAEMEHLLLGAIPREASLLLHLKRSFPNVTDVHLGVGGTCRYHLYVQMKKHREGEPKNVIMGAFGGHYDIKKVVVVDQDVNVHDPVEVEWATATRFQPDRDLVVVSEAQGSPLDPSTHDGGIGAKWGLDATRPLVYEGHTFTRIRIPGEGSVDLARDIDANATIPPARLED